MTMDPLSILASTITIIGAADVSAKGIKRLWALRDAPANLEAVMNEVRSDSMPMSCRGKLIALFVA